MTWDELFQKQFREVDDFKEQKGKDKILLETNPNTTSRDVQAFNVQWKKDREALYEKHKEEAEQYLDRCEAEGKRLTEFKKMAKEHPENEYWKEAVERMEKAKKQERQEEIQRYKERMRANERER
jgi:hypothetical protein